MSEFTFSHSIENYDVNEAKRQAAVARASKRAAMRREGDFDEDGEALFKKSFDWQIMRRLLRHLRPYWKQTLAALGLLIAYSAIVPIFPRLMGEAIDQFIDPKGAQFTVLSSDERINGLLWIVLAYMVLRLVNFGLRFGYTYMISWISQYVIFDIRRDVFAKVQRLHMGFFDKTPVGRLITRITSDIEAVKGAVTDGVVGLIADVGMIAAILVAMFSQNWRFSLVALLLMPLLFLTLNYLRLRIREAFRAVRLRLSRSNSYIAENLDGMKTIQLFNRETRNMQQFDRLNLNLLDAHIEQVRWFSLFWPTVRTFSGLTTAVILWYGATAIMGDSSAITVGLLFAFLQYSSMLFRPVQDLSDKFTILQSATASAERIFELIDTPEEIRNQAEPEEFASPFRGEVNFEKVYFAYGDDNEGEPDWVLRDVDVQIKAGESVALVGHTGAGKTTIISLLSRFYDVTKGAIKIDGKDIRSYEQTDLRCHVGIVLQDPFLFSGTVRSNITLNDASIPLEQVISAAKFVNAHNFIEKLPEGYDTPVRERGAGFSTGQKQLLAFARSLVQNPDILLVLDEATANVDTETELLIQDALEKLMQGRTSIIIAHRLSTIQDVDRILVMRKGKVVEQGSHAELLQQDGYYRKLYELQYAEQA